MDQAVVDWLLEGDPAIRWQVQRDLLDASPEVWQAERRLTLSEGWGAEFLRHLDTDGNWPESRWTGNVWTLLLLMDLGLPPDHSRLAEATRHFLDRHLTPERTRDPQQLIGRVDLCHVGFWLRIGAYFHPAYPNLERLSEAIFRLQMPDGGWNCRIRNYPQTHHGSFHTTFNVLEGLQAAAAAEILDRVKFREREARAHEFMLRHRMYRSDKTGQIIDERFTHLIYPHQWHYNVLRGLDRMRHSPEIRDPRLDDPIEMLMTRRKPNGRWITEKRIAGKSLFDMEKPGSESRWNTLRMLRVLKARAA